MRCRALWLASCCACSASEQLSLPLPAELAQGSVVLALAEPPRIYAASLPLDAGLRPPWVIDAAAHLEVHLFREGLGALGLAPGEVAPDPARLRPLRPAPRASFRLELGDEDRWVSTSTTDNLLSDLAVAEPTSRCASFALEVFDTPFTRDVDAAALVAPGVAVVVSPDGQVIEVQADGVRVLPSVSATAAIQTLELDDAGRLLAGGRALSVLEVSPAPRLVRLGPDPPSTVIRAVLAEGTGEALVVYTLSSTGQLRRFSRGVWSELYDFPVMGVTGQASLARMGPGWIAAGRSGSPNVVFVEGERVYGESPGLQAAVVALELVPGIGLVAADEAGLVAVRQDGEWRSLGASGIPLDPYDIISFRDGFILGGQGGYVAQYLPDEGFCPPVVAGSYSVRTLVPLAPDTFLIVGELRFGLEHNQVAVVRAR